MSKNALLEAPIASDRTPADSYHSSMDGNGQLRQAPAPHQWHQPYPPAPAPTQNRRWIPAAIISAGIIIAGAVVGGAVIMSHGDKADSNAVATSGQSAAVAAAADSSTCQAWKTTRATISMIAPLPQGWDWNTPNIDTLIGNRVTATETALNLFAPEIADQPADAAEAANDYVASRRKEMKMLTERTYTSADAVAVNDAAFRLNQTCGLSN